MSKEKTDLERLEDAIESMDLDPRPIVVQEEGRETNGYLIYMVDPTDLHELMRRTRGADIDFLPHELSDNVIVAYPRPC